MSKYKMDDDQAIMMTAGGLFLIGYRMVDATADISSEVLKSIENSPTGWIMKVLMPAVGGFAKGIRDASATDYTHIPESMALKMKQYHAILSSNMATGTGVGLFLAGIVSYIQMHPELQEKFMEGRNDARERRAVLVEQAIKAYGDNAEQVASIASSLAPLMLAA